MHNKLFQQLKIVSDSIYSLIIISSNLISA